MKAYFKRTRLKRHFETLNLISAQINNIVEDLKNEPSLKDVSFKMKQALNDGGGCSHFEVQAQLRTLLQSIILKEIDDGEIE